MELIIVNKQGISYDITYDSDDHELINKYKWHVQSGQRIAGSFLIGSKNPRKLVLMHRLILGLTDPKIEVDHINHDTLDNRKCNLRICTHSQNNRNKYPMAGKTSKYKGVSWYKNASKWVAAICIDYRVIKLGYFKDEIEAAKSYDNAAKIYFKKYAVLNFPD
jgi:hypothetical protein